MSVNQVRDNTPDHVTPVRFRSLYDQFADRVNRYLLARTGREDVAEDLTQDVFLAIWRSGKQLQTIRTYDAYVYRVARNRLVDYYRHRARVESKSSVSCSWVEAGAGRSGSEREALGMSDLGEARAVLSVEKQKLLDLIYYFELTYTEAAKLTGVPLGTFKRRIHDIRAELRSMAGRRYSKVLTGSQQRRLPTTRKVPVQYNLPDASRVKVANLHFQQNLTMDVYYPPEFRLESQLPVVIFIMGYSNHEFQSFAGINLREMAAYRSWGQLVAASGMIGICYDTDEPYEDIHTLIDFIRIRGRHLAMDYSRICVWSCSDNVGTALDVLCETQRPYSSSIRCGVIYYPVFRRKGTFAGAKDDRPRPFRPDVPLFYVEVGKEALQDKAAADLFSRQIRSSNIPLEYVRYEEAVHGFDMYMSNERTSEIVGQTLSFMKRHLEG